MKYRNPGGIWNLTITRYIEWSTLDLVKVARTPGDFRRLYHGLLISSFEAKKRSMGAIADPGYRVQLQQIFVALFLL